jgi:DNA polymerase-3 subunit alpha
MIRFGLDAVRDVGTDAAAQIAAGAPYSCFADFLERVPLNAGVLTSLIAAGALDRFGSRSAMTAVLPSVLPVMTAAAQLRALGQEVPFTGFHVDLSGTDEPLVALAAEHHVLGCYVSGHPIDLYDTADYLTVPMTDVWTADGERATLAGLVTSISRRISKRGDPYAVMVLEDRATSIEVLWFQRFLGELSGITSGEVVGVTGKVSARDEGMSLVGYEIERLAPRGPDPHVVTADAAAFDLEAVAAQLESCNGDAPVHLAVTCGYSVITFLVRH